MKTFTLARVLLGLVVVSFVAVPGAPASPALAQGGIPDGIAVDPLTTINMLLVDIEPGSQWENERGTGATIVLKNPTYSLFMSYSILPGAEGVIYSPMTPDDGIWDQFKLIPPGGTVRYQVEAGTTTQEMIIESNLLDGEALAITTFVQLLSLVPGVTDRSSSVVIQAIGDKTRVLLTVKKYVDMTTLEDILRNPLDVAGNTGRLLKVADGSVQLAKATEGQQLILDILQKLGIAASEDVLNQVFNAVSIAAKLKFIPDAIVSTGISVWSGSFTYRYKVHGLDYNSND